MARAGDDGVRLVGSALTGAARMGVNIRDDHHTACFTQIPEFSEVPSVEVDDTGIKRVRVDVVIKQIVDDAASVRRLPVSKEEGAAFAPAMSAGAQIS